MLLVGLIGGGAPAAPAASAAGSATTVAAPAQACDPVEDWDCIPEPADPPDFGPPEEDEETEEPDDGGGGPGGIAGWIFEGITAAIDSFFADLASEALKPLLNLLGNTLLTTPTPDELPQVSELWSTSWYIVLAGYSVLVMVAGLVVMGHQTLQTQYSAREMAPRIIVGFLASFLSLWVGTRMIVIANALSEAMLSSEIQTEGAANVLAATVIGALAGGRLTIFLGLAVAVFVIAILISYVVRVSLIVIMLAGAPLALACHTLPATEGVARWWWRTFAMLLAIQVAQSLTLVAALNVFLGPDSFTLFDSGDQELINLTTALALMYILWRIPGWFLAATNMAGGRRSVVGSVARGYLAYRTLGMLRGAGAGAAARGAPRRAWAPGAPGRPWHGRGGAAAAMHTPGPGRPAPGRRAPVRQPPAPATFLPPGPNPTAPPAPPTTPPPPPPPRPGFRAPNTSTTPPPRIPRPTQPPGMPTFQSPVPPAPNQAHQAPGPAPAATFRPPGQPFTPRPRPQNPRPTRPPGMPTFQPPAPPPPTTPIRIPQGTTWPTFRPPDPPPSSP
ncbi:hypothetical protein ABGB09_34950 [Streptomyces sp. B8F3]|uniref:hypothetical protein n=1 Tax=Streptomyces sp. B8F3 TaxID=3153573 RepID=UPI00325C7927